MACGVRSRTWRAKRLLGSSNYAEVFSGVYGDVLKKSRTTETISVVDVPSTSTVIIVVAKNKFPVFSVNFDVSTGRWNNPMAGNGWRAFFSRAVRRGSFG